MSASNRLFELKDVACRRGGRILFRNLSFGLDEGDVVHLAGPNGSGKTSLLRIMAGALPCEGEVLWESKNFLENGNCIHAKRFAFLPSDDRSLKVLETVHENLSFWARLWSASGADARISAALAALDVSALKDTAVRHLSAGQKRRVSLARVLVKDSPLWLLDEPFNGLDSASADLFKTALEAHLAKGGMAAIASHHALEPSQKGSLRRVTLGGAA